MIHTIAITVRDVPGVLTRVTGLFARRGYNIISMAVDKAATDEAYRFTAMIDGTDRGIQQITKQIHKLVDVLKVSDLTKHPCVETEVAMINVRCTPGNRAEILRLSEILDARVMDASKENIIVRLTGRPEDIETAVTLLRPHGIVEMARSGRIVLKKPSVTKPAGAKREPVRERGPAAR